MKICESLPAFIPSCARWDAPGDVWLCSPTGAGFSSHTHDINWQGQINPVHSRLTPSVTQFSWEVADGEMKFMLNTRGGIFGEVQLQPWLLQAPLVQGIPILASFTQGFAVPASLQGPQEHIKRSGTPEKPALPPWLSLDFPCHGRLKRKKRAETVESTSMMV